MPKYGIYFQCMDTKFSCCMGSFAFIVENVIRLWYTVTPGYTFELARFKRSAAKTLQHELLPYVMKCWYLANGAGELRSGNQSFYVMSNTAIWISSYFEILVPDFGGKILCNTRVDKFPCILAIRLCYSFLFQLFRWHQIFRTLLTSHNWR